MSKRKRKHNKLIANDTRPLWERLRDEYNKKTEQREKSKRSKHSDEYLKYLRSAEWQWVRTLRNHNVAKNKCERCGKFDLLEGHHLWYPHDLYQTTEKEIQMLCKACHNEADRERRAQMKAGR